MLNRKGWEKWNEWVLWENEEISLQAAFNPAIPRSEGFHVVLLQNKDIPSPWADPDLFGRMAVIAGKVSKIMMQLGMADWINIHCDGNIGASQGKPKMHIHIFGRLKTSASWGGPLQLPSGDKPYGNEPLMKEERLRLRMAFERWLDN